MAAYRRGHSFRDAHAVEGRLARVQKPPAGEARMGTRHLYTRSARVALAFVLGISGAVASRARCVGGRSV